ncbi:Hypothetical protein CINCED_3A024628 [Cinara cedri]|uniref:Uncharacterized protein n=1 Tax=Cinara cedri TaxID=506608 RepID=A0A5E4M9S4_9HEMI|nr:Hypothetical protein CINCED_3A024628 [Cinara cedri]
MKTNVGGKENDGEEDRKRWSEAIENDIRTASVCEIGDMVKWKFRTSPNSCNEDKGE